MRTLILLLILPLFGFGQTDFVKWYGETDLAPTILNNYVTSGNFTGSGLSGPHASYDGIWSTGWPNANNINLSKYYQVTLKPVLNSQVTLTNINFGYKGNCRNYEIHASKNADFSNAAVLHVNPDANYYGSDIFDANVSGLNIQVSGGETLYIRFYAYNGYNGGGQWRIRNGINLRGTVNSVPTQLAGTYTIGSAPAADFPTITSAVSALLLAGVSAPVTFLLDDTYYGRSTNENFPIVISPYTGNTEHTVTFKPAPGKNITIESTNLGSVPVPAVFKLKGVDNVIIDGSNNGSTSRNLTIYNNNPIGDAEKAVIWIASENAQNGAHNNVIKNLRLKHVSREGNVAIGVFGGSNGSETSIASATPAAAANSANTVANVLFEKVGQAIYVNGNPLAPSSKWQLRSNTIGGTVASDKPFLGIYLNNAENYEIIGNSIVGVLKNTTSYDPKHSGIYITGNSNGIINGNVIRDVYHSQNWTPCAGILIESGNNIISNNMISDVRAISTDASSSNMHMRGHGIFLKSGNGNKVFFNTVYMNSTGGLNHRSSALYLAAGSGHIIKNNIFYNSQLSGQQFAIYSEIPASSLTSDYNDFVPAGSNLSLGYIGGNNIANLTAWKASTGKDLNSVEIVPVFVSATNLHIDESVSANVTAFDAKGTPIADFALDIDGDIRHNIVPDLGADEFGPKCLGGTTTWNGSAWNNGFPDVNKAAVFSGDYTFQADLHACTVSIINNAVVTIATGKNLTVENEVVVSPGSSLVVSNNANLVQLNEVNNEGDIIVKRIASMRRLDYVYWSSPVQDQNLKAFSPQTVSPPVGSSRFYVLNEPTNGFVAVDPLITDFEPAKGYMIRAPNTFSNNIQNFTGTFTGTANNGTYSINVTTEGSGHNLIGNPYPSTINANLFLESNPGTLHFWTHIDQNSGNGVNYASYNLSGGTASQLGGPKPDGVIQTGQGFLLQKALPGIATFTNDMRIRHNSAAFYRSANSTERHRIWLNLTGPDTPSAQILLAYMTGATEGEDNALDGKHVSESPLLASNIGDSRYIIQARPVPFQDTDTISLTYTALVPGTYTFSIDELDGLFAEGQAIYLKDLVSGTVHDIKAAPYSFTSAAGSFSDRFSIVYQNSTLGQDEVSLLKENLIVYKNGTNLNISTDSKVMAAVRIYDIRGRLLFENTAVNSQNTLINMGGISSQVIIVQVTSADNSMATKKVVY